MLKERFSIKELIYIVILAIISIVVRTPFKAISELFISTFALPGGIINGVFYMFWLTAAYSMVGKPGTATIFCILQAFLGLNILGMPLVRTITFIPPGVVVDILNALSYNKVPRKILMILGGGLANVSGTVTVSLLIMNLPLYPLVVACIIACISGGFGGYFAYVVVKQLRAIIPNANFNFR